ncbi:hypothetical protein Tco_0871329, partial [Tanacetum coccineum]
DDQKYDRSRGGRISSGMKKSNIGDNTRDVDKVVGETIGTCGGIKEDETASRINPFSDKEEVFPGEAGK